VTSAFVAPWQSASAQTNPLQSIPITGTATNPLGQLVNFAGTFSVQRFAVQNGQLVAIGPLTGTLTNTVTGVVQTVSQQIALPVTASGTCDILHLTLGPLDLDLLGLRVHLNQVVLDITAQAAPGNLLGNLLCAVAHLLDQGGPLTGIASHLNQILRLLG
jgi:hypothetical protein